MTDWATAADVLTYTGITVTDAEVLRAQAIVELFAGTTTEASDRGMISTGNLRKLRRAVAYQAGWATEHPDVFTNVDVTGWSQDGASGTQAHVNAALLAPLAKRYIDRLTWQLAPLKARKPWAATTSDTGNRDSVAYDDNRDDWRPA